MKDQLNTPVLLILFNRPNCTSCLIEAVRGVQPKSLYVAVDGPRKAHGTDKQACRQVKELIKTVDWKCKVKTRFRKRNLGCKYGPVDAIHWFFRNESDGIILEDDTIPDRSFFYFCQELLEKYRHNLRIGMISGDNFTHTGPVRHSYLFSKYSQTNGWATWRRVWKLYDIGISLWPEIKKAHVLDIIFSNRWTRLYWTMIFEAVYKGEITTAWDYQWTFSLWVHRLLTIIPKTNLVSNIGFGRSDATHTKRNSWISRIPIISIKFPLIHPKTVAANSVFDEEIQKNNYILWKEVIMNLLRKIASIQRESIG